MPKCCPPCYASLLGQVPLTQRTHQPLLPLLLFSPGSERKAGRAQPRKCGGELGLARHKGAGLAPATLPLLMEVPLSCCGEELLKPLSSIEKTDGTSACFTARSSK